MSLQDTPRATRLHIGIFGKRNSGKSTLLNALTNQPIAVVSDIAGTTTDPIYKSMEISGIGPVVFIDTAGFDDEGELGELRVEKTELASRKTDIALMIFTEVPDIEEAWIRKLKGTATPVIPIINKVDLLKEDVIQKLSTEIEELTGEKPILVSAEQGIGIEKIREALIHKLPEDYKAISLVGDLVRQGDVVLLVMPQDIQAPKGRLILPQVQTLRELLDKKCLVMSCTTDQYEATLQVLNKPPTLIITDSQVFKTVYDLKPESSMLTSFSVLMAASKGDIEAFIQGVKAIADLTENSKVLIAEACTHKPLKEDIGREKIPHMLRKKIGDGLQIDIVNGIDFPNKLTDYDLIIHCGACMFNRKYVLSRIEQAQTQHVPITNYGVVIAYISGILDKISYCK
ncbi:[FeFe] hydrogenase H-cluster maturation GTPase HydF [Clostridium aminobutyricum]|uniref:[FeFe] hydrogenase H-cluster maturation GTPase HydF n=1 Tax=Clostridium aminobutyricum TaxID=33953 RepID=A0A939D996_CLOAM|nr:[FeFe] hydrogenase H-cluster maturation GTPase HydF [Clostridium aminobutyricum]MBN7773422.1 [FeFe] hydrogenase H-cluster maturation GTPase HydF [Clostridium aminobutyricum]